MLFAKETVDVVRLTTPKGILLFLEPEDICREEQSVRCAIRKDAGDDPDVTDGLLVYAKVELGEKEVCEKQMEAFGWDAFGLADCPKEQLAAVWLKGAEGIGTVTLPGLEQVEGAPAINRVPRQMIVEEVQKICREFSYTEGVIVTISAPAGVELARKTFNPRLGITGGISILGTSGIVEPMSESALVATIQLEMKQKALDKKYLLITPGNYGLNYLSGNFPFGPQEAVKCSNYVGQTIDMAINMGLSGVLFVAHIGKFVKVAGGIMNTHSKEADARMEILAACAIQAGAEAKDARRILAAVTTDEGLRVVKEAGVWDATMEILMERIHMHLEHRGQERLQMGVIVFSNVFGELGRTKHVPFLLEQLLLGN